MAGATQNLRQTVRRSGYRSLVGAFFGLKVAEFDAAKLVNALKQINTALNYILTGLVSVLAGAWLNDTPPPAPPEPKTQVSKSIEGIIERFEDGLKKANANAERDESEADNSGFGVTSERPTGIDRREGRGVADRLHIAGRDR